MNNYVNREMLDLAVQIINEATGSMDQIESVKIANEDNRTAIIIDWKAEEGPTENPTKDFMEFIQSMRNRNS